MYLHNLRTVLADLKASQVLILTRWMQKYDVVRFLQKNEINPSDFIEKYALRLISNVILMVEDDFEDERSLVTKEILLAFEDKDINTYDIFCLYQSLKDICIELIEEGEILSAHMLLNRENIIIDIYKVFECLTKDILYFYAEELFNVSQDIKEHSA